MPSSLVREGYFTLVSSLTNCTSAFCTTAPVVSLTCPLTVAVGAWANAGRLEQERKAQKITATANRYMGSSRFFKRGADVVVDLYGWSVGFVSALLTR